MMNFCGRCGDGELPQSPGAALTSDVIKWSEQKKQKVKRGRESEASVFSRRWGWRRLRGPGARWRRVEPLRLRGEEMTGLPQAPLCSSNGLLRRHGGLETS